MYDLYIIGIEPADEAPEHDHPFCEITYHISGEAFLKADDKEIKLSPGKIVIMPPNMPHSVYAKEGFCNIFMIVVNFNSLGESLYCFDDTANNDIYNILMQINNIYITKRYNWYNISESLIDTLYQFMLSQLSEDKTKNPYVESLSNILAANISCKNFLIDRAMKDIPLSGVQLRRLFKKDTGKTPLEYLNAIRIEYAKQLLKHKIKGKFFTIKEASNLAGFNDPYYFSRMFRKIAGKSPSEWIRSEQDK